MRLGRMAFHPMKGSPQPQAASYRFKNSVSHASAQRGPRRRPAAVARLSPPLPRELSSLTGGKLAAPIEVAELHSGAGETLFRVSSEFFEARQPTRRSGSCAVQDGARSHPIGLAQYVL